MLQLHRLNQQLLAGDSSNSSFQIKKKQKTKKITKTHKTTKQKKAKTF